MFSFTFRLIILISYIGASFCIAVIILGSIIIVFFAMIRIIRWTCITTLQFLFLYFIALFLRNISKFSVINRNIKILKTFIKIGKRDLTRPRIIFCCILYFTLWSFARRGSHFSWWDWLILRNRCSNLNW